MRVYKQPRTEQPLKYLIAFILFCLVLGWAFTDVYGGNSVLDKPADCVSKLK